MKHQCPKCKHSWERTRADSGRARWKSESERAATKAEKALAHPNAKHLTDRQVSVLEMRSEKLSLRQVGDALGISRCTVRSDELAALKVAKGRRRK